MYLVCLIASGAISGPTPECGLGLLAKYAATEVAALNAASIGKDKKRKFEEGVLFKQTTLKESPKSHDNSSCPTKTRGIQNMDIIQRRWCFLLPVVTCLIHTLVDIACLGVVALLFIYFLLYDGTSFKLSFTQRTCCCGCLITRWYFQNSGHHFGFVTVFSVRSTHVFMHGCVCDFESTHVIMLLIGLYRCFISHL